MNCPKILIYCIFLITQESICGYLRGGETNKLNTIYSNTLVNEELVVDEVVEDPYFKASLGIKKWYKLNMGYKIYLLGIEDKTLSLLTLFKRQSNIIQANEDAKIYSHDISTANLFKMTTSSGQLEAFVLVSFSQPRPKIMWYRIESLKLNLIYEWEREHETQNILQFTTNGFDNKLLLIESPERYIKIYQFDMISDTPHIWFVENLPISGKSEEPRVISSKNGVYLSLIENGRLTIYNYKQFCPSSTVGKFVKMPIFVDVEGFRTAEWFESKGNTYLATSGGPALLFTLDINGNLKFVSKFGNRMELIIIQRNTRRADVLILTKSDSGEVSLFGQKDSQSIEWVKKETPPCQKIVYKETEMKKKQDFLSECIGGPRSWKGAIYLDSPDFPSLLFADRVYEGEIFMLIFSLRPLSYNTPQNLYWYDNLEKDLGTRWSILKSSMDLVTGRSKNIENEGWEQFCNISQALTEFAYHVEDFRLRMNTIDCSSKKNLPIIIQTPLIPSSSMKYETRQTFEINQYEPAMDSHKDGMQDKPELPGNDLLDDLDSIYKS